MLEVSHLNLALLNGLFSLGQYPYLASNKTVVNLYTFSVSRKDLFANLPYLSAFGRQAKSEKASIAGSRAAHIAPVSGFLVWSSLNVCTEAFRPVVREI